MRFVPGCLSKCCEHIDPPCFNCTDGDPGDSLAVTFAGFTNGLFWPYYSTCDCSWLNATFILARQTQTGSPCQWEISGSVSCGTYGTVNYRINASALDEGDLISGPQQFWQVIIYLNIKTTIWYKNYDPEVSTLDCSETLNIPYDQSHYPWSQPRLCNGAATSTCQVN